MSEALRRQIKAAQTQINMDQDSYQQLLKRVTGKTSSTQLSKTEINRVLDEFKRLGWKPKNRKSSQVRAIQFLWMRLGEEGKLSEPGKSAMITFCKKYTQGVSLERADTMELQRVIEVLKSWCKRENVSMGQLR